MPIDNFLPLDSATKARKAFEDAGWKKELFFGLERPGLAFLDIAALLVLIVLNVVLFLPSAPVGQVAVEHSGMRRSLREISVEREH